MHQKIGQRPIAIAILTILLLSCESHTSSPKVIEPVTLIKPITPAMCENTRLDSQFNDATLELIHATDKSPRPPKSFNVSTRRTLENTGIFVSYMLHVQNPRNTQAKGLIVLFPDGDGDAELSSDLGGFIIEASQKFLVRSSVLFTQHEFNVLTINQPSDAATYAGGNKGNNGYDTYRTSMRHTVDIVATLKKVNTSQLTVIFVGLGRGAISAMANSHLAAATVLINPTTSASEAAIGEDSPLLLLRPSLSITPTYVAWQADDQCQSSRPVDSQQLQNQFLQTNKTIDAFAFAGGFEQPDSTACEPLSFHGFLGIESCAVNKIADWAHTIINDLNSITNTPPVARPVNRLAEDNTASTVLFSLRNSASDADGDALVFSVPQPTTNLGGHVSITLDGLVSYTPAEQLFDALDTFVYLVTDSQSAMDFAIATIEVQRKAQVPAILK